MARRSSKPRVGIIAAVIAGVFALVAAVIALGEPLIERLVEMYLPLPTPTVIAPPDPSALVQRIEFDYQDSPTRHGWTMVQGEADETDLAIEHLSDPFVGSAISISSPLKYGMDHQVGQAASQVGRIVEFVGALDRQAAVYAWVGLKRDDGTTATGWLQFQVGSERPRSIALGTGSGEDEWLVYIRPVEHIGGDWLLFRVDLSEAVAQTFGGDGWSYEHLEKFRVRGSLSLDYIFIYKAGPYGQGDSH